MAKGDIIDFTLLQKKGFLKTKNLETEGKIKTDKEGFVDFGQIDRSSPTQHHTHSTNQTSSPDSPFSFLDNLQNDSGQQHSLNSNSETNELRIKLDDAEYKIRMLEERIKELEKKVN